MKPWQGIRTGVGASVLAHLLVLSMVFFLAEVHPFGAVTAEPIAVDIVTPEDVPAKEPDFRIPDPLFGKSETPGSKATAKEPSAKDPAKEAATPAQQPAQPQPSQPQKDASQKQTASKTAEPKQAALQPAQPDQPQATQQQTPLQTLSPSPVVIPAPIPQAPDISEKYHVMLGLPPNTTDNVFDELATTKADLGKNIVTEFRRHLKSCSKLPSSISPTDTVTVTLRVFMEPDGKFAADPMLVAGTGSAKGPVLMQSVIKALQACQPYNMLPADRYAEWKVLDLNFTPQNF